jgi:hypothetical protein
MDDIQARSENTDENDKYDLDDSDSGSIGIYKLDDLLELPSAAEMSRANQTVQQDAKLTDDNDDVDLPDMDSGCVVLLVGEDIVEKTIHPMERSELLPENHTPRLLLDETKTISEISDTNDDYSMARHDCESVFYDVTSLAIPLDDLRHDWGIYQSLVVVRRLTFRPEPNTGKIMVSFGYSYSSMEVSTIGIHRHECWDPGGQQKKKTDNTTTSKFATIGDDNIYTIFELHLSVYVWDPGGLFIDLQYSVREYYVL